MATKNYNLKTHGHCRNSSVTPTYGTWAAMLQRCYNKRSVNYKYYGAIGVAVCESWRDSFESFLADMGEKPKGHTLDRKKNDLGYFKENCQWSTQTEQVKNRSNTVFLEHNGVKKSLAEWASLLGIKQQTLLGRIRWGWTQERILTTPTLFKQEIGKITAKRRVSLERAIRQ